MRDLILSKLDFFQQGGSDKHIRDTVGVLRIAGQSLDAAYIEQWVGKLRLNDEWHAVLARAARPD